SPTWTPIPAAPNARATQPSVSYRRPRPGDCSIVAGGRAERAAGWGPSSVGFGEANVPPSRILLHRTALWQCRRDNGGEAGAMESGVRWAWDRQSVWSQAADRVKRSIERYRAAGLILGIIGACAATAATQLMAWSSGTGKALALLSAVAVGFIPLTTKYAGP